MHSFGVVVAAFLLIGSSGAYAAFSFKGNNAAADGASHKEVVGGFGPSNGPFAIKFTRATAANGDTSASAEGTVTTFGPRNNENAYFPLLENILDVGGYFRDDGLCAEHCAVPCVNEMLIVSTLVHNKMEPVYIGFARCNALGNKLIFLSHKFLIGIGVGGIFLLGIAVGFFAGANVVFRHVKAVSKIGIGTTGKLTASQDEIENF